MSGPGEQGPRTGGNILGVGMTHFPAFLGADERMSFALRHMLASPGFPPERAEPANWPAAMRAEWGSDEGLAAAARHRAALVRGFRKVRAAIDEFRPDALVVFGDDQYENFQDDLVPPFCLLAYDDLVVEPWRNSKFGPNPWGEPDTYQLRIRGDRALAKAIVSGLLEAGVDMAYAYRPGHHQGLPHAFLNTVLYLDHDRRGLEYPVLPLAVNCYGRRLVANRGLFPDLKNPPGEGDLDPPSPAPWRCFDVGRALARVLADRCERVVFIASASWSHSFLCASTGYLHPDTDADLKLFEALQEGRWEQWRAEPLASVEAHGHQELLNWVILAGAMAELGRVPAWCEFVETNLFNSNKVFALCPPPSAGQAAAAAPAAVAREATS